MYKSGVTADKVNTYGLCSTIQCLRKVYRTDCGTSACEHSDRCYSDALVNDRNTVFAADILTGFYEILGIAADLIVNLCTCFMDIGIDTVEKRDAHGNGADIQILVIDHIDSFKNIMCIDHEKIPTFRGN